MSTWIRNQVKNYDKKQHVMQNDNIRELFAKFWENYKIYFMSYEMHWENMLNNVKTHIDKYGTKPSTIDKSESIKKLGSWLNTQQNIYDRQEHIMKNIDIRKKYEHFLNTYEEHFLSRRQQWFNTLDVVKIYIDVNKKRPSKHTNDLHVQKLANWLGSQKRNYDRKENIMKYDNVRESWEQFITSHQQYFPDNPAIQSPEKPINNEPVQKLIITRDSASQKAFKDELLKLYDNKCIITGSTKPLEGAHIIPYSECNNFKTSNGLLLRADIHVLFDDFDLSINPDTTKVELSKGMQSDETYKMYHMKKLKITDDAKTNLMVHYKRFMDKHGEETNGIDSDVTDDGCKPKKIIKVKRGIVNTLSKK